MPNLEFWWTPDISPGTCGVWSSSGAAILSPTESISAVMVCGYSAVIGSRISTFHGQEVQNQGTFRNVSWFLTPLQRHGRQANPNLFLSFWAQPWTRVWPGVKSVFNGESCNVWEQPTRIIQQLKHHSRNLTSPIALDLSGSWTTKMQDLACWIWSTPSPRNGKGRKVFVVFPKLLNWHVQLKST